MYICIYIYIYVYGEALEVSISTVVGEKFNNVDSNNDRQTKKLLCYIYIYIYICA